MTMSSTTPAGRSLAHAPASEDAVKWRMLDELVVPLGLAVLFTAVTALIDRAAFGFRDLDAAGATLVVAAALALAPRRRFPVLTVALVTGATSAYLLAGYVFGPILVALVIALYGLARRVRLAVATPVTGMALVAVLAHNFETPLSPSWSGLLPGTAWVVVPFAFGIAMRTRQEAVDRERTAQVRLHVDAERLRVSRDVHDVVGHGLAAINMQANLALRSVERNPDRVPEALHAISSSSSAALGELRAVLARMDSGHPVPRQPAPGLAELPTLVDRLAQTGMRVQLDCADDVDVSPAVGLAAYRVVQESLTNALRYGAGHQATVTVDAPAGRLDVTVTNPVAVVGQSHSEHGSGLGIPGMNDRVQAVGGTLTVTPGPHTFEVHATIPREE